MGLPRCFQAANMRLQLLLGVFLIGAACALSPVPSEIYADKEEYIGEEVQEGSGGEPTAPPTTAAATTAKPTTAKPTTAKPTTAKPTTLAPTTKKSTKKPTKKPTRKPTTRKPRPTKPPRKHCFRDFYECRRRARSLRDLWHCMIELKRCFFTPCVERCDRNLYYCQRRARTFRQHMHCVQSWEECMNHPRCRME